MSSGPETIISVAEVNYDGATAVELRREVIALRDNYLGPEVFDPRAAVVLSHAIALLGALIERTWPDTAGALARAKA